MNDEQVLVAGAFSEQLLNEPDFQFLSAYYEQRLYEEFMASQPHETKRREATYNRLSAHRDFIAMLAHFAKQKQDAETPSELDEIDDPSVHDIYR